MTASNFSYLEQEYPILFNIGQVAEYNLHSDPVTSLFKLRQFGERLTEYIFEEHHLEFPYDNSFHNRLKTLEFEGILPDRVKDLLHTIKNKGNLAVHQNKGSIEEARSILFSSFKVAKWFYQTYSDINQDISAVKFHPPANLDARHALNELEKSHALLEEKFEKLLKERDTNPIPDKKVNEIRARSSTAVRKIDMTEAETRELIDEQLRQAGWGVDSNELNFKTKGTRPERGKNLAIAEWPCENKWADYALFIGKELYGIVEAKKYASDISTDFRQIWSSIG
jgi:type I restriction enzyme R subunit